MSFAQGYLTSWTSQQQVWDHMFSPSVFDVNPADTQMVFTEPLFDLAVIRESLDECFFEEFGFGALVRTTSARLASLQAHVEHETPERTCMVVDCGYSFSHAVPCSQGRVVDSAVQRVNVGGKLLTNYLKDIVSYRQLNVMEETYVINECKENACFISLDLQSDFAIAR